MEMYQSNPGERTLFLRETMNQGRKRKRQTEVWKTSPRQPALPVTLPHRHLCLRNLAVVSCSALPHILSFGQCVEIDIGPIQDM